MKLASQAAKRMEDNATHENEVVMSTTSLLGKHSQGVQSFQTSRVVGTHQCQSDQYNQGDDLESVKEEHP